MPLLWISLCFVAGLVCKNSLPWSLAAWLGITGVPLILWPLLRRLPDPAPARNGWLQRLRWTALREPRLRLPPLLLCAALGAGGLFGALSQPDLSGDHIAAWNGRGRLYLQAVVIAPPDRRDQTTHLRLQIEQVTPIRADGTAGETRKARGLALAILRGRPDWQYGDRLMLRGLPETPPEDEDFSYRDYLARQDVYTYLVSPTIRQIGRNAGSPFLATIYHFRDWAYGQINHLFPAPESALLAGILLGIESDLPAALAQAFQDTGTAHIIAISGFNIAILAELFSRLFGRIFSRWRATFLAILAVGFYTLLVGASPSVVRAAIMGSLSLIAGQIGRRSTAVNTLALAAAVMCLFDPHLPWNASFQLSFLATLGLILYADPLQQGFTTLLERRLPSDLARRIAGPVGEYFLFTLAAQAVTLPVILYHYQRLSLSALLANPLVLPPQPLVMILSGLAVLTGLVSDPLAHLLAGLALPVSTYTIRLVEALAGTPGGVVELGQTGFGTSALVLALVLSPALGLRFPALEQKLLRPGWLLVGALLAAAFSIRGALSVMGGDLRLTIRNVEGSQVVLLRAPSGETLLIDGGPSPGQINTLLGGALPPLGGRLHGLLLNDPQADAMSGMETVLERYPPQKVFWGCQAPEHRTAKRLVNALRERQIATYPLAEGGELALGPSARLTVVATSAEGSALRLNWQKFQVLFPGGIPPEHLPLDKLRGPALLILAERDLSETSLEDWQALLPQAVFTTLEGPVVPNWINIPPEGWVTVTTDGEQMWIEGEVK